MDMVFEIIIELLFEGSIEISSNKKISKWVRYPIAAILILFFSVVIFGLIITGVSILSKSLLSGIFIILVGVFLLVASIFKFRKMYLEQVKK